MPITFGNQVAVAIAPETAYNEAWVFPTYGIRQDTITLAPSVELMENNYVSGQGFAKADSIALGRKLIGIGMTIKLHKEHLGYFLRNICGIASSGLISGSFNKHMFTVPASTPPSFRMVVQLSDKQYEIRGIQIQKMDLNFKVNDWIMVTLNCIGGAYITNTVGGGTITYAAINGGGEPGYKFLATNWSINGVTVGWNELTLTFERQYADGIEDSYEAGNTDADNMAIRKRLESSSETLPPLAMTLKVTGLRNDDSIWTLQKALTTFESFIRIGGPIDTAAYYLGIDMGICKVMGDPIPTIRGLGLVQNNFLVKAFHSAGTFYPAITGPPAYPASDFRIVYQSTQAIGAAAGQMPNP